MLTHALIAVSQSLPKLFCIIRVQVELRKYDFFGDDFSKKIVDNLSYAGMCNQCTIECLSLLIIIMLWYCVSQLCEWLSHLACWCMIHGYSELGK